MSLESTNYNLTSNAVILEELAPVAEAALNTHLDQKEAKLWYPHEIVPFEKLEEVPDFDDATLSALYINGLTEDNLPHYTATIKRIFGREEAWGEWNNRWTWEESLHTRGIERFIDHTGVFDADWLESTRKAQLSSGEVPEPDHVAEVAIYVTIQEELTRIAHSRLGQRLGGVGKFLLGNIAGDEGRHHRFYAAVSKAMREQFPDEFAIAVDPIIRSFEMPGTGIPGFKEHSAVIDRAGIFTASDVVGTIGKLARGLWNIDSLGDDVSSDTGKKAHNGAVRRLAVYERKSSGAASQDTSEQPTEVTWLNGRPILAVTA